MKAPVYFLNKIKTNFNLYKKEDTGTLILAAIIGLAVGLMAVGLIFFVRYLSILFWGAEEPSITVAQDLQWYLILLIPTIGGLIVWVIVNKLAPASRGHGVPDVMEAVFRKGGIIRSSTIWGKSLSSSITISTGGSAGMEAPIVQIGGAIGSLFGQFFKIGPQQMQTLVAAGTAAGIGAVFNAPMAGAIFAAEVIIGNFSIRNFSPIIVASVVGTSVSHGFFGNYPAFTVPGYHLQSFWEYGFYILLGIISGVSAAFFIKIFYAVESIFHKLTFPDFLKPALGGLLVGGIAIMFPQILGPGYHTIQQILDQHLPLVIMLALVGVKVIATSITLGSGGSGGVFAPAFFLGAASGGAFGYVIHSIFPEITADYGAYALVGMGGFMAGMISAPLTAILMIFEITTDYEIILPLMFTCIISAVVAKKMISHSIFTYILSKKGIELFKGRDVNILKQIPVSEVMRTNIVHIHLNERIPSVLSKLLGARQTTYFVTDKEHRLKGLIDLNDIKESLSTMETMGDTLIAMDLTKSLTSKCFDTDSLGEILGNISRTESDEIPVVDKNGVLLGSINWQNIVQTYNKEINKHNMVDHLFENITEVDNRKEIEILGENRLIDIAIPPEFVGKTLKQLDLRRKYGISVLAIKHPIADSPDTVRTDFSPDPSHIFEGNEAIIFMVPKKKRDALPFC